MNPASDSRSGGQQAPAAAKEADTRGKKTTPNASPSTTPATDMQPQDTGTAASGPNQRATAAESVMKQEQKTQDEGGSSR